MKYVKVLSQISSSKTKVIIIVIPLPIILFQEVSDFCRDLSENLQGPKVTTSEISRAESKIGDYHGLRPPRKIEPHCRTILTQAHMPESEKSKLRICVQSCSTGLINWSSWKKWLLGAKGSKLKTKSVPGFGLHSKCPAWRPDQFCILRK